MFFPYLLLLFFFKIINATRDVNICKNCKFFIKYDNDIIYSKCLMFPKMNPQNEYNKRQNLITLLVTGHYPPLKVEELEYFYCSTARDSEDMCGKNGKKFRPNNIKF